MGSPLWCVMHEGTGGCHRCNATKPFVRVGYIRPVKGLNRLNITFKKNPLNKTKTKIGV